MNAKELEIAMWEAAKNRNAKAFLEVVDKDAIMVCGGFRCSGADYAEIIKEFDVASYEITGFEKVVETEELCQVHYVIKITVSDPVNKDLEGAFHITSTWKMLGGTWKLVFNMDSRIFRVE
ncbi:MAG: nuclear transport factor 2 family protein [Lachnospiraceae bacterium]|nr:nuclear transport factor 2 family protein [Lachnospiraceae bacterium]